VNYASGVAAGAFHITVTPVRTNRSTQHWVLSLEQPGADGDMEVVITATAMTALRRETWHLNDALMPPVPAPGDLERRDMSGAMEWLNRYDMRFVQGAIPEDWDGSGTHSLSQIWVRDAQPRALDFASLASMSDVFFPRVWLRRATRVPAGTVSMTIYFHANAQQLADHGTQFLLAQAQGQAFRHGFFDQSAQLWSQDGTLLVTSHQLVYFKA
jgi:acyl-CoA thioesterase